MMLAVGLFALLTTIGASTAGAIGDDTARYMVIFEDSVKHPQALADEQAEEHEVEVELVYRDVLEGYAATMPEDEVSELEADPRVDYVEPDARIEVAAQTIPTGIDRAFATANTTLDIDGKDDGRVDVDVAVLDTGIDTDHPDLNVVSQVECGGTACVPIGNDPWGEHGTHVAGTIGAIDNGEGVVGVVPGARLWSVKVLRNAESYLSEYIQGINWVTAHADQIEVANASLGSFETESQAFDTALEWSLKAGIVHVVSASNEHETVKYVPASNPELITVSALEDKDGAPGEGKDQLASFSNFGSLVDVAAPGVDILSTLPGGKYGYKSGTSMASPHVAGAAAILAAKDNPDSKADVDEIRDEIVEAGNLGWTDTSGDGIKEPLLDLSDEGLFDLYEAPAATTRAPSDVTLTGATLRAGVNPMGPATTYQFEYGPTDAYGTKAPASRQSMAAGTAVEIGVEQGLTGLDPGRTYHFRIVASNEKGTSIGEDQVFTTGVNWETDPSEGDEETQMQQISCPSTDFCMAMGFRGQPGSLWLETKTWDGSEWSPGPFVASKLAADLEVRGLSCSSETSCLAGGYVKTHEGKYERFAYAWDGDEWTATPDPGMLGSGISCPAADMCMMAEGAKAATWNGSAWTPRALPTKDDPLLWDVSCASKTSCVGVGKYGKGGPAALRWNGSGWTVMSLPTIAGAKAQPELSAVSCISEIECVAVGTYVDGEGDKRAVAARMDATWSAAWSLQPLSWPEDASGNQGVAGAHASFESISCSVSWRCTAAGSYRRGDGEVVALGARLVGNSWNLFPFALQGHSKATGVSCTMPTSCSLAGRFPTEEQAAADVGTLSFENLGWTRDGALLEEGASVDFAGELTVESLEPSAAGVTCEVTATLDLSPGTTGTISSVEIPPEGCETTGFLNEFGCQVESFDYDSEWSQGPAGVLADGDALDLSWLILYFEMDEGCVIGTELPVECSQAKAVPDDISAIEELDFPEGKSTCMGGLGESEISGTLTRSDPLPHDDYGFGAPSP